MSSSQQPPPGPPPSGPPPPGGTPPPPPPNGSPPPNSADTSSVTNANYFFGFVITFVVLLLLFVGCGIGSWRRFRLIGTAWDERLQDMEGSPFATPRKRGRRRLVRPVFSETWTDPMASIHFVPGAASDKEKWGGVQPISAALIWSRSKLSTWAHKVKATTTTQSSAGRGNDGSVRGVVATLRSYVIPRRPRCDHPPRPPPVTRPPPEAIQVAVMIAMPSPSSLSSRQAPDRPQYVGQPGVREYEIGVVRIPWPSGEGP
ncbi:hypothetical protein V8E55_007772 [Tylopilus felleus]